MRKEGSALILMLVIVLLLTVLGVSVMTLATSSYKANSSYEKVDKVRLAAEAGLERGKAKLKVDFNADSDTASVIDSNSKNPKTYWFYDSTISSNVSFHYTKAVEGDKSTYTVTITSIATDGKVTRTLSTNVIKEVIASAVSIDKFSDFNLKRKVMGTTLDLSAVDAKFNLYVDNSNTNPLLSDISSRYLILKNQEEDILNSNKIELIKQNGNDSGSKLDKSTFFETTSITYTVPNIKKANINNSWIIDTNNKLAYYIASSQSEAELELKNNGNTLAVSNGNSNILNVLNNTAYGDYIKIIMVNGNIKLTDIDAENKPIHLNAMDNLILYSKGYITLSNCNLKSPQNGNKKGDINISFISDGIIINGTVNMSYMTGNNSFGDPYNDYIGTILTNNIDSGILWK